MKHIQRIMICSMCIAILGAIGCKGGDGTQEAADQDTPAQQTPAQDTPPPAAPVEAPAVAPPAEPSPAAPVAEPPAPAPAADVGERIGPDDLTYLGAFRLPDGPDEIAWGWSGEALTYYPDGNADGDDGGLPGSLFGTGHNWNQYVSEISIPQPVVSADKNLDELNTARTLQEFADVHWDGFEEMEQPRAGLAYLPAQGEQAAGKLYMCFGPHLSEPDTRPSHGWCELDLANPQTAGPWQMGGLWPYLTADYLLAIPQDWADQHTPTMRLGTGRFRDGGQSSQGPTLIAAGPWNHGNPPEAGATIDTVTLLQYSNIAEEPQTTVQNYHHSDQWTGAAWLTAGERSAVIFVGTKGQDECWYGFGNGVVWPEEGPWPDVPDYPFDQRGWWSTSFVAQIMFYDPADLAAVAAGTMQPGEPQPYATMNIDEVLYREKPIIEYYHVGAAAFDNSNGLLYIIEPRGDEDKSLIHVWRVAP